MSLRAILDRKRDRTRVRLEAAELDWGDVESEARDLLAGIRRRSPQVVVDALERLNDLLMRYLDADAK
jgi:hypothetical protein